jgi:lycopene beta-cyclase
LSLYDELHRIIRDYNLELIRSRVINIESNGDSVKITTDTVVVESTFVFDSRPPVYLPKQANDAHLIQSFFGWMIKTDQPIGDVDCIDLMDFNVNQMNSTQFMYVLPYDSNTLLVELTRFGVNSITKEEAQPELKNYIQQRFGSFTVMDTEDGQIPMSTLAIQSNHMPGVIPIGSRAGAVKPSTGYAFKNMISHAQNIAAAMEKGAEPNIEISSSASRFKLYDRLLLVILTKFPHLGKSIFKALFEKNKVASVLWFLDEKTTWLQDIQIFLSLPKRPFLQVLASEVYHRFYKYLIPFFLLLLSAMLYMLFALTPDLFQYVEPILFATGLIAWGIPHGAIDHLLEGHTIRSYPGLRFICLYLIAMGACFLLWMLSPALALLFFLTYSIWHFGESDMKEWFPLYKGQIKNWIWGGLLLGGILLTHWGSTLNILIKLGISAPALTDASSAGYSLLALGLIWGLKERSVPMILSVLMLWVSSFLPLVTSFGLYFIGQHSLISWSHLKKRLDKSHLYLFGKALPFTAGACILFTGLLYLSTTADWDEKVYNHAIKTFFLFIACISFPHVIVMHRFYSRFDSTKKNN